MMADDAANQQLPYGGEYAKSGRASCKGCKNTIEKGDLRMSLRTQSRFFDGLQDNWFHFDCFWGRAKADISEATVRGFSWLKWEDQEKIRARCQMIQDNPSLAATPRTSYPKVEHAKGPGKCFKCKEKVTKGELRITFKASNYHIPCFFGEKLYSGEADKITGFEHLKEEEQNTIKGYLGDDKKKKAEKRKAETSSGEAKENKKAKVDSKEDREKLKNQSKVLWETLEKLRDLHRDVVTELLEKNNSVYGKGGVEANLEQLADRMVFGTPVNCNKCGGNLRYSESAHGYVCTGNVSEYTKCRTLVKNPERKPFKVPSELREEYPFLKDYHKKSSLEKRVYSATVENTVIQTPSHSKAEIKRYERRLGEEETKRQVKNGCVVDPLCEVASDTHVFVEKKKGKNHPWQALLCAADIATGKNSYYKLQLLKGDRTEEYYIFRSWGRTGTTIGGNKTSNFHEDLDSAKHEFERLFLEKSKNEWSKRHKFVKQPNALDLVEMDYDERASVGKVNLNPNSSKSNLAMPIKEIISLFFDTKLMNSALVEFDLDVEKMPLGKLSHKHILSAHSVLSDIEKLILSTSDDKTAFLDFSNKFFSLIPHSFGMGKVPLIDSMEILKKKTEMLDSLLEMERAYHMLKAEQKEEENDGDVDTFDRFYKNLKCGISVLPNESEEFELIQKYATNTHGKTHNFQIDIKQVFKIDRDGEEAAFKTDIDNRQLLWHGSRLTNFAGILSQGLRIAPPEAPVNGYMFGKGVYFADMISKSAQYCSSHDEKIDGFLLLCEVALGNIQEEKQATNIVKPKSGFHSVKGLGGTAPSPKGNVTLPDGTIVPCGKAKTMSKGQDYNLLYNEYIVYDEAQIKMKYLVRASIRTSYAD